MNQENNQVQNQTQQLTPEELQKTQVLNLQELEETIKFEKKVSKKPAIIIALIGLLSITIGSSVFAINTLSNKKENSTIQKKEIKEKVVDKKLTKSSLTCFIKSPNNQDGTDTEFKIIYDFDSNKLTGFTKNFVMVQTPGNQQGHDTVEVYKVNYQAFLNPTIGYQITLSPKDTTGIMVNVQVDFEKLDIATVNPTQQSHFSTSIDYQKDTTKQVIQADMIAKGYICQ